MDFPLAISFITSNVVFLHHNCFYCNNQVHFSPGWLALPSKGSKTWRCKINGKEKPELSIIWSCVWECEYKSEFVGLGNIFFFPPEKRFCAGTDLEPLSALGLGSSNLLPQLPSLQGSLAWATKPPGVASCNRITATKVTLVPQNVKWKFSFCILHSTCFLWSLCIFWISHSWHPGTFSVLQCFSVSMFRNYEPIHP